MLHSLKRNRDHDYKCVNCGRRFTSNRPIYDCSGVTLGYGETVDTTPIDNSYDQQAPIGDIIMIETLVDTSIPDTSSSIDTSSSNDFSGGGGDGGGGGASGDW